MFIIIKALHEYIQSFLFIDYYDFISNAFRADYKVLVSGTFINYRSRLRYFKMAEVVPEMPEDMYQTTNSTYGTAWQSGAPFQQSFSQSTPYRTMTNRREVKPSELPKDQKSLAVTHDPRHPCGIQVSLSFL